MDSNRLQNNWFTWNSLANSSRCEPEDNITDIQVHLSLSDAGFFIAENDEESDGYLSQNAHSASRQKLSGGLYDRARPAPRRDGNFPSEASRMSAKTARHMTEADRILRVK